MRLFASISQGAAPYLGGGFGHFYSYADTKQEYPINRFTMEIKRQLSVLDNQLATTGAYICGDQYTIADMAIWTWYGNLVLGVLYGDSVTFLNVHEEYPALLEWAKRIQARPAVQRGRIVNRTWGDGAQLVDRHSAADIDQALEEAAKKKEVDEKKKD